MGLKLDSFISDKAFDDGIMNSTLDVLIRKKNLSLIRKLYRNYKISYNVFFDYELQIPITNMWSLTDDLDNSCISLVFNDKILLGDVFLCCKIYELAIRVRDDSCRIEIDIDASVSGGKYVVTMVANKKLNNIFNPKPTKNTILDIKQVLKQIDYFSPDNFYVPVFFRRKYFKDNALNHGSLREIERLLMWAKVYENSYNGEIGKFIRMGTGSFDYHLSEIRGFYVRETHQEKKLLSLVKSTLSAVELENLDKEIKQSFNKVKDRIDFNLEF